MTEEMGSPHLNLNAHPVGRKFVLFRSLAFLEILSNSRKPHVISRDQNKETTTEERRIMQKPHFQMSRSVLKVPTAPMYIFITDMKCNAYWHI